MIPLSIFGPIRPSVDPCNLFFLNSDQIDGPWILATLFLKFGPNLRSVDPWDPSFKIWTTLAVRGSLHPLFKIRTDLIVRGSLQSPFKIRTKSAIHGYLPPSFKIRTKPVVRGPLHYPSKTWTKSAVRGSLRSPFLSRETVQIHYFGSYSLSPLDRPLYDCMTVQFHWFGPSCLTPMVDTGRIRTIPVPRSLIKTIGWYRWVIISSHFSRKWLNSSEITWFGPYVLNMWLSYVKNSVDSWTPSGVLPFYWKIGLYELGPSMVQVLIDQYYSSTKTYAIWLKIKLFSSIWTRTISEFI